MERHAAQAPALRERNHNFRHFRSFLILAHLFWFKTVPSGVKYFFEIASD
jgi:hypothetical protein